MPEPLQQPGHVLVRPLLMRPSDSDVHMLHHAAGKYRFPIGTTGHEVIAEVMVGDGSLVRPGGTPLALAARHTGMVETFLARAEDMLPLLDRGRLEYLLTAQQMGTVIYAWMIQG